MSAELLKQLSASCAKHQSYHVQKKIVNDSFCQGVLDSLRKIVPKLEKQVVADYGALCSCYLQIIKGDFCPHAPQLFLCGQENGKEGTRRWCG